MDGISWTSYTDSVVFSLGEPTTPPFYAPFSSSSQIVGSFARIVERGQDGQTGRKSWLMLLDGMWQCVKGEPCMFARG
jgi:hypothetical protein